MRLQVMDTRNVASVTFPSHGETWLAPSSPSGPSENFPSTSTSTSSASSMASTVISPTWLVEGQSSHPQDTITLPPEALLENAGENNLVKMVFFSYEGLQRLLQPNRGYTDPRTAFKVCNRKTKKKTFS